LVDVKYPVNTGGADTPLIKIKDYKNLPKLFIGDHKKDVVF